MLFQGWTGPGLSSVHFRNEREGSRATAEKGLILATRDGGRSWSRQRRSSTAWLSDAASVDSRTWCAVGQILSREPNAPGDGIVLRTTTGKTLESAEVFLGRGVVPTRIYFASASSGWIIGARGLIETTVDGGKTWNPRSSRTSTSLRGIAFLDARRGWVVGDRGEIRSTDDGGATWNPQASGTQENLQAIDIQNSTTIWAVGRRGMAIVSRGGKTWKAVHIGDGAADFFSIRFATPRVGWVAGRSGSESLIWATVDGGANWTASPVTSISLSSLDVGAEDSEQSHGWRPDRACWRGNSATRRRLLRASMSGRCRPAIC